MWLLGAGAPRSAGLPTAYDIIWDLKKCYYSQAEHLNIDDLNIGNESIRKKIQGYMDSKGFPQENSLEEYSFYFDLLFRDDRALQRQYLTKILIDGNYEPNIGFKILAALTSMDKTKLVFTTNFDNVFESAYAEVLSKNLSVFHLEGAEGALNAINNSSFPFYVKLHGDYRYQSIKNLSQDLLTNNEELGKCFLAASMRFGLIVAGYSGRDVNVMSLLHKAIEMPNPFPCGIFWMVPDKSKCLKPVLDFIEKAKSVGIVAEIIEIDSFDSLMNCIWASIKDKSSDLLKKIKVDDTILNIALPQPGKFYPVIRLNAFQIITIPQKAIEISDDTVLCVKDLKDRCKTTHTSAIMAKTNNVLAWGATTEIKKVCPDSKFISEFEFSVADVEKHGFLRNFVYRGLVAALCKDKPLRFKKLRNVYHIIPNEEQIYHELFLELKNTVGAINGVLPKNGGTWTECLRVKLDFKNDSFWLVVTPDIWIEPSAEREKYITFLKSRKGARYNIYQNNLLNIWKKILFGDSKGNVEFLVFDGDNDVKFVISSITAFAYKGGMV